MPMNRDAAIYVAGHRGLVGSALVRRFKARGFVNLLTRTHGELDLIRQAETEAFFEDQRPEVVILAAAKVGGIHANRSRPADFIGLNLAIQSNVLQAALATGVKRLLFLGSSCIYPRLCPQPMQETHLLGGPLEPTNQPYAVAKIAGIIQCDACNRQHGTGFLAAMPTNLYGPNDNFDLQQSHVLPALIRKFHLAKLASQGAWEAIGRDERRFGVISPDFLAQLAAIARHAGPPGPDAGTSWGRRIASLGSAATHQAAVELWGSGLPRREFLHVDDLADACLFLMNLDADRYGALLGRRGEPQRLPLINIGCGRDQTIGRLASVVAATVGYDGAVRWNSAMPDGSPQKLLDVSRMEDLGWRPRIDLEEGIGHTYRWYREAAEGGR